MPVSFLSAAQLFRVCCLSWRRMQGSMELISSCRTGSSSHQTWVTTLKAHLRRYSGFSANLNYVHCSAVMKVEREVLLFTHDARTCIFCSSDIRAGSPLAARSVVHRCCYVRCLRCVPRNSNRSPLAAAACRHAHDRGVTNRYFDDARNVFTVRIISAIL